MKTKEGKQKSNKRQTKQVTKTEPLTKTTTLTKTEPPRTYMYKSEETKLYIHKGQHREQGEKLTFFLPCCVRVGVLECQAHSFARMVAGSAQAKHMRWQSCFWHTAWCYNALWKPARHIGSTLGEVHGLFAKALDWEKTWVAFGSATALGFGRKKREPSTLILYIHTLCMEIMGYQILWFDLGKTHTHTHRYIYIYTYILPLCLFWWRVSISEMDISIWRVPLHIYIYIICLYIGKFCLVVPECYYRGLVKTCTTAGKRAWHLHNIPERWRWWNMVYPFILYIYIYSIWIFWRVSNEYICIYIYIYTYSIWICLWKISTWFQTPKFQMIVLSLVVFAARHSLVSTLNIKLPCWKKNTLPWTQLSITRGVFVKPKTQCYEIEWTFDWCPRPHGMCHTKTPIRPQMTPIFITFKGHP